MEYPVKPNNIQLNISQESSSLKLLKDDQVVGEQVWIRDRHGFKEIKNTINTTENDSLLLLLQSIDDEVIIKIIKMLNKNK